MSNPVDVAHVTTVHPRTDNRIFRKECVSLARAGFAVALLAAAPEDEVVEGVRLVALRRHRGRLRRMVLGPVEAWRALARLNPNMIHVHDPELIPLAIVWRLVRRRPAVFDAHEDLPKQITGKSYIPRPLRTPVAWLARGLESAADLGLSGVIAATPAIERNFRRAPVTLVQNFPWLRDFTVPSAPDADIPFTLCYVGGISRDRGGLEMIEAVRQSQDHLRLVLAGPAFSDMAAAVEADPSGLVDYRGILAAEDVPGIIAGSHAGLVLLHPLPNYLESQPTKIFEYMASGRPFIASDFPAWKSLLARFDCGIFIDPADVDMLIEVTSWLKNNPNEARGMGERGRQALETSFTFEEESLRLIAMTRRFVNRMGSTPLVSTRHQNLTIVRNSE